MVIADAIPYLPTSVLSPASSTVIDVPEINRDITINSVLRCLLTIHIPVYVRLAVKI